MACTRPPHCYECVSSYLKSALIAPIGLLCVFPHAAPHPGKELSIPTSSSASKSLSLGPVQNAQQQLGSLERRYRCPSHHAALLHCLLALSVCTRLHLWSSPLLASSLGQAQGLFWSLSVHPLALRGSAPQAGLVVTMVTHIIHSKCRGGQKAPMQMLLTCAAWTQCQAKYLDYSPLVVYCLALPRPLGQPWHCGGQCVVLEGSMPSNCRKAVLAKKGDEWIRKVQEQEITKNEEV